MLCDMLSCSVMSNYLWPLGLQPASLLCPWGFSRQEYWSALPWPPPGDLPNPGIEPRSPSLQVDPLTTEQPGKPKNTGVDSPSVLQGIFPTQESNQNLLHCRWILYKLSYQWSPDVYIGELKEEKLEAKEGKTPRQESWGQHGIIIWKNKVIIFCVHGPKPNIYIISFNSNHM